jgi:hypothetical protein
VGAHGEAVRDPVIVPPPTRCRVTKHGLVLIPPPDESAIARGGGWCLAVASPVAVEWSPWLE